MISHRTFERFFVLVPSEFFLSNLFGGLFRLFVPRIHAFDWWIFSLSTFFQDFVINKTAEFKMNRF
jgi:hypothetical protein